MDKLLLISMSAVLTILSGVCTVAVSTVPVEGLLIVVPITVLGYLIAIACFHAATKA